MISEKDRQLIAILKADARQPISEIARQLKVSRTTVQQRLSRLESNGYIIGYTTKLSEQLSQSRITAHVNLAIDPNKNKWVVESLEKLPAIETLLTVSGKVDLIAILSVDTTVELDRQLDVISLINGIKSTETHVVLSVKFDRS